MGRQATARLHRNVLMLMDQAGQVFLNSPIV